jgi:co-chaperonin GroES (HSP10)
MQKAIMDRIFVKPDEAEQKAIIIEEKSKTKTGVVQSVGDEVKSVKVGDHIIFYEWDLEALDGLTAIREKWVLGVLVDD